MSRENENRGIENILNQAKAAQTDEVERLKLEAEKQRQEAVQENVGQTYANREREIELEEARSSDTAALEETRTKLDTIHKELGKIPEANVAIAALTELRPDKAGELSKQLSELQETLNAEKSELEKIHAEQEQEVAGKKSQMNELAADSAERMGTKYSNEKIDELWKIVERQREADSRIENVAMEFTSYFNSEISDQRRNLASDQPIELKMNFSHQNSWIKNSSELKERLYDRIIDEVVMNKENEDIRDRIRIYVDGIRIWGKEAGWTMGTYQRVELQGLTEEERAVVNQVAKDQKSGKAEFKKALRGEFREEVYGKIYDEAKKENDQVNERLIREFSQKVKELEERLGSLEEKSRTLRNVYEWYSWGKHVESSERKKKELENDLETKQAALESLPRNWRGKVKDTHKENELNIEIDKLQKKVQEKNEHLDFQRKNRNETGKLLSLVHGELPAITEAEIARDEKMLTDKINSLRREIIDLKEKIGRYENDLKRR